MRANLAVALRPERPGRPNPIPASKVEIRHGKLVVHYEDPELESWAQPAGKLELDLAFLVGVEITPDY